MKSFNILLVDNRQRDANVFLNFFIEKNPHIAFKTVENSTQAWPALLHDEATVAIPKILFLNCVNGCKEALNLINNIRSNVRLKSTLIFVLVETVDDEFKNELLNLNIAAYITLPNNEEEMRNVYGILEKYLSTIEFSQATNTL